MKLIFVLLNPMKKIIAILVLFGTLIPLLPLDVEFPLVQSIVYFPYNENNVLPRNKFSLSLDMFYSNIFTFDYDKISVTDMEMLNNTIGLRYGLTDNVTLELYSRIYSSFGGIMDQLIIDFHDTFGYPVGGRDEFAVYGVNYKYKDYFSYNEGNAGFSHFVFSVISNFLKTGIFKLNGRVGIGIPLAAKPGYVSDKSFLSTGLIFSYQKNGFSADLSTYLSFYKRPEWLKDEEMRFSIFMSDLKLQYKRFFIGCLFRSSPYLTGDLGNHAWLLYLGYKISRVLEIYIVEELPPMDTTADVTFRLKINILLSGNGK